MDSGLRICVEQVEISPGCISRGRTVCNAICNVSPAFSVERFSSAPVFTEALAFDTTFFTNWAFFVIWYPRICRLLLCGLP